MVAMNFSEIEYSSERPVLDDSLSHLSRYVIVGSIRESSVLTSAVPEFLNCWLGAVIQ